MLRIAIQSLKIVTIGAMTVLVLLIGLRFYDYFLEREAVANTGQPVVFTIHEDDGGGEVADRLADADLIRSTLYFELRLRFADGDLIPGTYTLRRGMSVPMIIDALTGEVEAAANVVLEVRTGEGWRSEEVADAIQQAGYAGGADSILDAIDTVTVDQYDFLADRPEGASLEGYLFPDTYEFNADAPPEDIILTILDNFNSKFSPEMQERARAMNLTVYQVLTIASIIEREAAVDEERAIIASVYYNRLETGMDLEADPTVQYVVGKPGDWWPLLEPEQLESESPYNTYLNGGFPPGPICNPSLASIQAALNPAETDFLFFVAKGDGTHAFAATFEEHQANVDQYINNGGDESGSTQPSTDQAARTEDEDVPIEQASR